VALSLGSLPAGVARRLVAVEPGLSSFSIARKRGRPAVWPVAKVGSAAQRVKPHAETRRRDVMINYPESMTEAFWEEAPAAGEP